MSTETIACPDCAGAGELRACGAHCEDGERCGGDGCDWADCGACRGEGVVEVCASCEEGPGPCACDPEEWAAADYAFDRDRDDRLTGDA